MEAGRCKYHHLCTMGNDPTSGGQTRCGCGRRPRALRRGRWGHLPVLPGGSTFAAFAAVLGRALLGPFTEGQRPTFLFSLFFVAIRSFPCLLSDPPVFCMGGRRGETQLGIPLQFKSQKVATLQCCLFGQKGVDIDAGFIRPCSVPYGALPSCTRTIWMCSLQAWAGGRGVIHLEWRTLGLGPPSPTTQ